jgi:ABC-type transport system involved in multi-copper enzyme maturation permease subunit
MSTADLSPDTTAATDGHPGGRATGAAPAPAPAGTGHSTFGRLLISEWTKLRTVRSTVWSLVALVAVSVGFTVLILSVTAATWASAQRKNSGAHAILLADPVPTLLGSGLIFGQLAICVLGVLAAANEYSTGMIRSTLLASPHRLRMLAAKCAAFAVLVFLVGEALSFCVFAIGGALLKSHVSVALTDRDVLCAVIGVGLYLAVLGLLSLAVGQIVRHTAGAITATVALIIVVDPLAGLLPGSWGAHVSGYLPSSAGAQLLDPSPTAGQVLSAWEGFAVFGLWTALLLAVAGWLLVKRDA